jgi:uncharacterized protein (TIGR00730 family)
MDLQPSPHQSTPAAAPLSVCLFCGSSNTTSPAYLEAASTFGRLLANDGVRLVYGGGGVGLMGRAAKAAHAAGGKVYGVIPEFLRTREVIYDEVETTVVRSMHERKNAMYEASDAFAIFPGGIGTLEEVVELISWRRLDLHRKPIVFADLDGFWQPFFRLIDHTVDQNLTPPWLSSTWASAATVEDVLPTIRKMLAVAAPAGPDTVVSKA